MAKRIKKEKREEVEMYKNEDTKNDYCLAKNAVNTLIIRKKNEYYRRKIEALGLDIKKLYTIIDNLTGNRKKVMLPEGFSDEVLSAMFLDFFEKKIENFIGGFVEEARLNLLLMVDQEIRLNHFVPVHLIKVN